MKPIKVMIVTNLLLYSLNCFADYTPVYNSYITLYSEIKDITSESFIKIEKENYQEIRTKIGSASYTEQLPNNNRKLLVIDFDKSIMYEKIFDTNNQLLFQSQRDLK